MGEKEEMITVITAVFHPTVMEGVGDLRMEARQMLEA
jgi:hypothetical protein